ncbi:class I SAM-dependent methyltransferase [Candidatus Colwellia aromaticivorans]|uniref:class I SAM-dependent methyltransferase n=1 Tax=Candidatus Colwellia aromaticivorans TaxID=2267621 RepID=UPI0014443C1D|nr:class I SAM-dependent methyltransferase [Candidatus Colwellia aromaticivorans]
MFAQYQSVSFENVHNSWIQEINFKQCKTALAIGAGSGRDALASKHKKLCVTAIEPSDDLRALGQAFTGDDVTWLNDTLPKLEKVKGKIFDIILVSAVWMHLSPQEQTQSLQTISTLLNDNDYLIITLRHGGFSDTRTAFEMDANRTIHEAKQLGLSLILSNHEGDKISRDNVSWHTLCFKA